MMKMLNVIAVFIAVIMAACAHVNAAEMNEEEYARLKNRLASEFMQKLMDEIKDELIAELKSEYTIEPKQTQEAQQTHQAVSTPPAEQIQPSNRHETQEPYCESEERPAEELHYDFARRTLVEELSL